MKTHIAPSSLALLAAALLVGTAAQAGISGIVTSTGGSVTFDDTNSFIGLSPGNLIGPVLSGPWTGTAFGLPVVNFAVPTGDSAQGEIDGAFTASSYALNLTNVLLNQAPLNTGFATLHFFAIMIVQPDAFGFTSPALYPSFIIDGTVQTGGVASLGGNIAYTAASAPGVKLDTVDYNYINTTPGNFTTTVSGVPVSGSAFTIASTDQLVLTANFYFTVDPATIHATTVPEPSSALLALLAAPLLLRRRRA